MLQETQSKYIKNDKNNVKLMQKWTNQWFKFDAKYDRVQKRGIASYTWKTMIFNKNRVHAVQQITEKTSGTPHATHDLIIIIIIITMFINIGTDMVRRKTSVRRRRLWATTEVFGKMEDSCATEATCSLLVGEWPPSVLLVSR